MASDARTMRNKPSPLSARPRPVRPDRNALGDWTLTQVHELVFGGGLAPGDVLTEVDLSERLGVSRSPVRDALKDLEATGIVDVDPVNGRRTLRAFTFEDIEESYSLRCELEALAARYAARQADDETIQVLSDRYDAMVGALLVPYDEWLDADFAFHAALAAASGTRRLPHILNSVWLQHMAFLRRMDRGGVDESTPERRRGVLPYHERILAAVRSHDPKAADAAVRGFLDPRRAEVLDRFRVAGLGTI